MCRTAQVRHASRQPQESSIHAVSGQPMVLAKPAISVMPVMGPRAPRPNNPASVENATSYRPKAMPIPITTHPAAMPQVPVARASNAKPVANSTEEVSRSGRPPCVSTRRPAMGASAPAISSAAERPAKMAQLGRARSRAIGTARMAGR